MQQEIALKCLTSKHYNARAGAYAGSMKADLVRVLADNVRRFMDAREDSQADVASRAGISQRAVGDLLTYGRGHFKKPTLKTLDGLARAFEIAPWMLVLPDISPDIAKDKGLETLIENYRAAPPSGRANISRVADAEVRYAAASAAQTRKTGT